MRFLRTSYKYRSDHYQISRKAYYRLVSLAFMLALVLTPLGAGADSLALSKPTGSSVSSIAPKVTGADFTLKGSQYKSSADTTDKTLGDNLTLPPGRKEATFTSGVTQAPLDFTDVGARWRAETPEKTSVLVEIRTSRDSQTWTDWQGANEEEFIMPQETLTETFASPIAVPQSDRTHRFVQSRITLRTDNVNRTPVFRELTYTFIDAGVTTNAPRPQAMVQGTPSDVPKPVVVSRADWGAPEGEVSPRWTPKYRRVTNIIIHHTATPNNDTDWAARVRAIWYYHANTRGWGDIGYNYIIDPNGVIYEGRAGGDDVEAGHAYPFNTGSMGVSLLGTYTTVAPSNAAQSSLVNLVAWKVNQRGIDPQGVATLTGYTNCGGVITYTRPTIGGHRDYAGTACGKAFNTSTCPGDVLYSMLPRIRASILSEQPPLRAVFAQHDTPGSLAPGATANVKLSIRNSGSLVWPSSGRGAVTVGYGWYTPDLKPVKGGWQDIRTALPRDVPFADTITVTAKLNAPNLNGRYALMWDMYLDGTGWFSEQGSSQKLRVDVVLGTSKADQLPPTSSVLPLPIYSNNPEIAVRWAGQDEPKGSGVASYDVQSRVAPGGQWTNWQSATSQTQATFQGQDGFTYEFRSRARDASGNVEAWPNQADAYTTVDTRPPPLIVNSPQEGAHVPPGPLVVTGSTEPGAFITVNDTRATEASGVFTATVQAEGRDYIIHVTAADAAGNISRLEVVVQAASRYNDVPVTDPDLGAIEALTDLGIVGGYPDGSFRPNAPISRAQFAKFLGAVMKWGLIKPQESRFGDVPPDSPLFAFVETAAARGYMKGYTDGTFRPNAPISRADATRTWVAAAGWKPATSRSSYFLDVPQGFAAAGYIETARLRGLIAPDDDGNFRPYDAITRVELSRLAYRYVQITPGTQQETPPPSETGPE